MAYKVLIGDVTVICDTAQDALALIALQSSGKTASSTTPRTVRAVSGAQKKLSPQAKNVLRMLEAVRGAGQSGITAKQLAESLGMTDARGLGGYGTAFGHLIGGRVAFDDVITRGRSEDNERAWMPGPKIDEAISLIELHG
jgi:hypothetical protein